MESSADAWVQLQRAEALIGVRRFDEAAALAYEAAGRFPHEPGPYLVAARAESGRGDYSEGESAAAHAVTLAPDLSYAHQILASVVLGSAFASKSRATRRSRAGKALKPAKAALRLDPDNVAALLLMAEAAAFSRHLRLAKKASDHSIALAPDRADTWMVRAQVARKASDYELAESAAREALRLDPHHYAAGNELGLALAKRGKTVESLQQLSATASLDPTHPVARRNLMRYGRLVSYFFFLLILAPLAIVWPFWLACAVGANVGVWRYGRTRRHLENWTLSVIAWRVGRASRRRRRKVRKIVAPDSPIKGEVWVVGRVSVAVLAIGSALFVIPATYHLVLHPATSWETALVCWIVFGALALWTRHLYRGVRPRVPLSTQPEPGIFDG